LFVANIRKEANFRLEKRPPCERTASLPRRSQSHSMKEVAKGEGRESSRLGCGNQIKLYQELSAGVWGVEREYKNHDLFTKDEERGRGY